MNRICIITDTSSGLWPKDKISNLEILPLYIIINNYKKDNSESITTNDSFDFEDTLENFNKYNLEKFIPEGVVKTSQIPPAVLEKKIEELKDEYDQFVVIPVSYNLSGQYNGFVTLLKKQKYKNKLFIFHNNLACVALGFAAKKAATMAHQGSSVQEIYAFLQKLEFDTYIACCPGDLKSLIKSGRVKILNPLLRLANLLKVSVLVEWLPKEKKHISRTFKKSVIKFINFYYEFIKHKIKEKYIVYCSYLQKYCDAKRKKMLRDLFSAEGIEFKIQRIANVFPANSGLNCVGFFILAKNLTER